jgi:hypothetical protein
MMSVSEQDCAADNKPPTTSDSEHQRPALEREKIVGRGERESEDMFI